MEQQHVLNFLNSGLISENAPETIKDCLLSAHVSTSLQATQGGGSKLSMRNVMLRTYRSTLIHLYKQVYRGNLLCMKKVAQMYAAGMCVPQLTLNSVLWDAIPYRGKLVVNNGETSSEVSFSDLCYALKVHIKEAVGYSELYIPTHEYLTLMQNISKFGLGENKKPVKNKFAVRISNAHNMYLMYRRVGRETKLVGAFLAYSDNDQQKYIDFTYQASLLVPSVLPEHAFGKKDITYCVFGKLDRKPHVEDMTIADYKVRIRDWIYLDTDRSADVYREKVEAKHPARRWNEENKDRIQQAIVTVNALETFEKLNRVQRKTLELEQAIVNKYEEGRVKVRAARKKAKEEAMLNDPYALFEFIAVDLFAIDKQNKLIVPSVEYPQIVSKFVELGFNECKFKKVSSGDKIRTAKDGSEIYARTLNPECFWQKIERG